jgi:hypothetical protein
MGFIIASNICTKYGQHADIIRANCNFVKAFFGLDTDKI